MNLPIFSDRAPRLALAALLLLSSCSRQPGPTGLLRPAARPATITTTTLFATVDGYIDHGLSSPTDCTTAQSVDQSGSTALVGSQPQYSNLAGRQWVVLDFGPIPTGSVQSATLTFKIKSVLGLNTTNQQLVLMTQSSAGDLGSVYVGDQPGCGGWNLNGISIDIDEPTVVSLNIPASQVPAGGWLRILISDQSTFDQSGEGQSQATICTAEFSGTSSDPKLSVVTSN
jgi:hypothetical protein